ncbi:MAG: gamma-glutamyl-gamma-aminobutyrate hydrolase family protein [Negativicutes bacterium]
MASAAHDYIHAVELAGGIPVILPDYDEYEHIIETIEHLDGILFAGGNDVGPLCYGAYPSPKTVNVTPNRDLQEIQLARYVVEDTQLPAFFICRGNQIINVAFGGTLYQDVEEHQFCNHSILNAPATEVCHKIKVGADSLLNKLLNKDTMEVNSLHHQAVDKVGSGLVAAAWADDGVIEALELIQRKAFLLSVQWHPEMLVDSYSDHRKLLEAFIASAGRQ